MDTWTSNWYPDVALAANWLDEYWSEDEIGVAWFDAVDLRRLSMASACRCVAGQLGTAIADHYGLAIDGGVQPNPVLNGYGLLIGAYENHDNFMIPETREQAETLILYAEKVLGHRHVPDKVNLAFSAATPAGLWVSEILRRRAERKS